MATFPSFNIEHLENIARLLGEEITGSQLTNLFTSLDIEDTSGESTKWKRIYHSLLNRQQQDRCGNNVAAFIKTVIKPVKYTDKKSDFENVRSALNRIISFDGLMLDDTGEFRVVEKSKTISEAHQRAKSLDAKLYGRDIHRDVLRFCHAELLQDNYFHAVFEATKCLAQKIRDLTGLELDGCELVDRAFSAKHPLLVFNKLKTKSEKSEHIGFSLLLKGCFSAIRNPRAHEPKILWNNQVDDAADCLTLISLLYKKLDIAIKTIPVASSGVL